jgi:hypothetical protein
MKLDGLHRTLPQGRGKVHPDRAQFARVFQFGRPVQDFVHVEVGKQVELDARVVLEHAEPNRVLAADEFLVRVYADVEVIGEQIVIRPPRAVFTAQEVGARGPLRGGRLRRHQEGEQEPERDEA